MGQAKNKSRSREAVLNAEPRCIYCPMPAVTVEHMPPRGMFRNSHRPSGMEFGTCVDCNNGTRGSDAVAMLLAHLPPLHVGRTSWQAKRLEELKSTVRQHAPGILEEIGAPNKHHYEWMRPNGSEIARRAVRVSMDGPLVAAHLSVFGAKLGMALYREHVGSAIPPLARSGLSSCSTEGCPQKT